MNSRNLKSCPSCGSPIVEFVVFGASILCEQEVCITDAAVSLARHPCGVRLGAVAPGTVLYGDVLARTLEREPRDPSLDELLHDLARPHRRERPDND